MKTTRLWLLITSGIAVQSGTKTHKNIIDILSTSKYFEEKPYIVHRLDKETSEFYYC